MYPDPLTVVSRKLTKDIVVSASSFKRFTLNVGARMALFHYNNSVIVWSAMPFGTHVQEAFELLTGSKAPNVTHLIVPDMEHTMAAKLFKAQFPDIKIIAMENANLGDNVRADYAMPEDMKHITIDEPALEKLGVREPQILDNFEFVYLPYHGNKELVMYDKRSKTVFEADLMFNVRLDVENEQYSEALGYAANYWQHGGLSFMSRYLNPDSRVGRFLFGQLVNLKASSEGLRSIYSWDFDRIVMCHGNIIESGGKAHFAKVFGKAWR